MKGTIKEVLQIIGGMCRITVEVPRVEDYEKLKKFESEKTECSIEIKKWFNKRSLDSNAYAWKLMSEMADKLSVRLLAHTQRSFSKLNYLISYNTSHL